MGFPSNVYSDAYKRLSDWLVEDNTGGAIENLVRDLLNRAQEELRMYRMWEELSKREEMTVNSDNTACLPEDLGEIIGIYHDADNDGRPDFWYWNRSKRTDEGYYFVNDFDRLNGYQRSIKFYASPAYSPIIWYVRTLEAFEGTNASSDPTEYSFFPNDLLVATAQVIHKTEEDILDESFRLVEKRKQELLIDYEESHQWVNTDFRQDVNDAAGNRVTFDEYNLFGGVTQDVSPYDNDFDLRGIDY